MKNHLRVATHLVNVLENRFSIGGFRFGLDPLLGLFPGIGDIITIGLSLYIVWIARQMKVPADVMSRMISNVIFDFVLGLFPVVGDMADFIYKSNVKNLELLRKHAATVVDGEVIS